MSTLERLKDLEAKATPGQWFGRPGMLSNAVNVHGEGQSVIGALCVEDADLVITLRNGLPKLLAVIEAAEEYFNDDAGEFNPKYFPKRAAVQKALKALHES